MGTTLPDTWLHLQFRNPDLYLKYRKEMLTPYACWYTLQTFPTQCQALQAQTFFSSFHPSKCSTQRQDTHQSEIWNDKGHPYITCEAGQGSTPNFFPIPRSLWNYQWFSDDFRLWNTLINRNPLTHSLSRIVYGNVILLVRFQRQHDALGDTPQWWQ